MRVVCVLVALACTAILAACSGGDSPQDSTNATTPTPSSGGAIPTFTSLYTNVLALRCAPCHTTPSGNGITLGHLDMSSRAVAYSSLSAGSAKGASCGGRSTLLVVAGQPSQSLLFLKISLDDPAPCGEKMPFGGAPLVRSEVNLVAAWIVGGANDD